MTEISRRSFDRLLAHLGKDRAAAGARYEALRSKIIKLLECRGAPSPEEQADQAIDRVAAKLEQGEPIQDLSRYCAAVARLVALEAARAQTRERDARRMLLVLEPRSSHHAERQSQCLDRCLDRLPRDSRSLLLGYYKHDRGDKAERRQRLAAGAGIALNALRIRVHRLRTQLERCLNSCLEQMNGPIRSPESRGRDA